MNSSRIEMIRQRLEAQLAPQSLEIIDDSHQHAGHSSAGGMGHFTVKICAAAFEGKSPLQRHRLVYDAVAELMQTEIHALSIHATAPVATSKS
jgi:BolA protein